MDIDCESFWHKLPAVLQAISEATFVSIDLEMTGVTIKKSGSNEKLSLSEAYQEAKEVADTFQILQVGLTCASYDEASSTFSELGKPPEGELH